mgnify:CR=1 FL=1
MVNLGGQTLNYGYKERNIFNLNEKTFSDRGSGFVVEWER